MRIFGKFVIEIQQYNWLWTEFNLSMKRETWMWMIKINPSKLTTHLLIQSYKRVNSCQIVLQNTPRNPQLVFPNYSRSPSTYTILNISKLRSAWKKTETAHKITAKIGSLQALLLSVWLRWSSEAAGTVDEGIESSNILGLSADMITLITYRF